MKDMWGQGDKGMTSLYQQPITKQSKTIRLLGGLDELGAHIGYLMCYLESFSQQKVQLSELLKDLFDISALLAETPTSSFDFRRIKLLENWTQSLNQGLRPITQFIQPTGNKASCNAHICRTITRRVESLFFEYYEETQQHLDVGAFLNRLSDYFFVLTRFINAKYDLEDYYK